MKVTFGDLHLEWGADDVVLWWAERSQPIPRGLGPKSMAAAVAVATVEGGNVRNVSGRSSCRRRD